MPGVADGGTLGTNPYPAAAVPFRLALLVVLALAPAAHAQTAAPEAGDSRAAGLAALAVGDDSVAAARLGVAVRQQRRSAPTHLAHALALTARDRRASSRAIDRALRLDPALDGAWAARLRHLRRPPAAALYSMTDSRRTTAARRLIALDSGSALGHAELAERSVAAFRYNKAVSQARGIWGRRSWQARRAWGAYENAEMHLGALLATESRSAAAHRLSARLALLADSATAFDTAARRALAARPWDGDAAIRAAAAAWRVGDAVRADALARDGLARLADSERYTSPVRFVRTTDRDAWLADSLGWAEAFWAERDTRRLTPVHDRFLEHLARMVEADLLFRVAGSDVPGWATDRGDTWVRYGRPEQTRWWLQSPLGGSAGEYEHWTYPDASFLFNDPWQGGRLDFASSSRGEDDVTRAREMAASVGERYDPVAGRASVQMPLLTSAFRSADGRTDVIVAYGIPFAALPDNDAPGFRSLAWASADGVLLDERRRDPPRIRRHDTVGWDGGRMWTTGADLTLPAGDATIHVEAELADGTVGQSRLDLNVPRFRDDALQMSDVLLAAAVGEVDDGVPTGAARRGDLWMQPLPWPVLADGAPLWVYVEMYGLQMADGGTRFEVEATLQPVEGGGAIRRGLRRLLGRRAAPGVATGATATGQTESDAQALLLDVSGQRPGRYRLTLTVRDRVAGTAASSSRDLLLEAPRP